MHDEDQPITLADLNRLGKTITAAVATAKAESTAAIAAAQTELTAAIATAQAESTAAIATAQAESTAAIAAAEQRSSERSRDMQTEILRGIEAFARGNFARMHRLETSDADTNARITALEERVLYLETRRPPQ